MAPPAWPTPRAYVLATLPGWPLGWRLFGRRHAGGWIAGALLGYALSAWTIWASTSVGFTASWQRIAAWAVVTAIAWGLLVRDRPPLVALPAWTSRDTVALTLVLALVPLLVARPFPRVGEQDAAGTRYYRAYFTADVVWHVALTTELRRFTPAPRNPYTADRPLHYYWTYFQVPAAITTAAPRTFGDDPLPWLLINATGAGLLFFAVVFLFAWTAQAARRHRRGEHGAGRAVRQRRGRLLRVAAVADGRPPRRAARQQHRRRDAAGVRRVDDRQPAALALVHAAARRGLRARPRRADDRGGRRRGGAARRPDHRRRGPGRGADGEPAARRRVRGDLRRVAACWRRSACPGGRRCAPSSARRSPRFRSRSRPWR